MASRNDETLTNLKRILGDHVGGDVNENEITVAEIMAEELYHKTTDLFKTEKDSVEPLSQVTANLKNLAEEIRQFEIQREIAAESEETRVEEPKPVIAFGANEQFEAAFKPSGHYIGTAEDDGEAAEKIERRPSRWKRWRAQVRNGAAVWGDITPDQALKTMAHPLKLLRLRAAAAPLLLLPLLYITSAQQLTLPLPDSLSFFRNAYGVFGIIALLQILTMLLCADIILDGVRQLLTLQLRREFAMTVSNFACLLHVYAVFLNPTCGYAYLPLNALAAAALTLGLWSRYWDMAARFQTCKTAAGMKQPVALMREESCFEGQGAFLRRAGTDEDFVQQMQPNDQTHKLDAMLTPLLSAAALLFAVMSSFGIGEPGRFFWVFSTMALMTAPFTAALSFSLPHYLAAKRLARFNACFAGWTAVRTFTDEGVAVLTDHDIFPPGRVTVNGLKMFGEFSLNRVMSQTASVLAASGSGLISVFHDLLRDLKLPNAIQPVEHFEFYDTGGFSADLDEDRILVGNGAFMLRMGVELPSKLPSKTAVYVAVNLSLAAIFPLVYSADKGVRRLVRKLLRYKVPIVLACRDFNITPTFLKGVLRESVDLADYPTIDQRLALSSDATSFYAKPVALMGRDTLFNYTECLVSCIRLRMITRINLFFHTFCGVGGLLLIFYLNFAGRTHLLPNMLLAFLGMFLAPILLVSLWANRN